MDSAAPVQTPASAAPAAQRGSRTSKTYSAQAHPTPCARPLQSRARSGSFQSVLHFRFAEAGICLNLDCPIAGDFQIVGEAVFTPLSQAVAVRHDVTLSLVSCSGDPSIGGLKRFPSLAPRCMRLIHAHAVRRLTADERPSRPRSSSNVTRCPSARSRIPAFSSALMCTNTSLPPSSGAMNPKPFVLLNHFTVPVCTLTPFRWLTLRWKFGVLAAVEMTSGIFLRDPHAETGRLGGSP